MKKFFKNFWFIIPLVLAGIMFFALPYFPDFTEYVISRGLFKVISVPLGFISSLAPISITEILAVLALPALIFLIVLFIVKMKKSEKKSKTALSAGKGVCCFLSAACFLYMTCHGANFYRQPVEQLMGLDVSQKDADQLLFATMELIKGALEVKDEVKRDENGVMVFSEDIYTELLRAESGYDKLCEEYPFLWTSVFRQKPVMLSDAWSYTRITGMYFPFLCECNVNTAQPDYSVPSTAAHESAHSRGIAFENDCNFLAFLSCIKSEYPEYRYSGYMSGLSYCLNALYANSYEYWVFACQYITDDMRADFDAYSKYLEDHSPKASESYSEVIETVQEVSEAANDTFIKVQGVEEGVLSYNRVTELILAYYCK